MSSTIAAKTAEAPAWRRFGDAWNEFWFEPVPSHSLCLLRFFFGFVLTLRAVKVYGLYRIHDMGPELPRYEYNSEEIYGAFTMPWPLFDWIPAPTLWWYNRIDEVLLVLLVLFTVGFFTRIVGLLIAAILAYVFLSTQLNFYHHVWCYTLVMAILAFSHCGDRYSLDSYLKGPSVPRPMRSILPLRMIQVLMTLLYSFTFVNKLNDGYLSGRIMFLFHEAGSIEGPFYAPVLDVIGYKGLAWFTLFAEGMVPIAIWFPRLRLAAIGVGVALHLGIDMLMSQRTFSYQMMVLYIAFIHPAAGSSIVLFDGSCGLCRRSRRIARLFDWLCRTTWLDFRDPKVAKLIPTDELSRLERRMAVVSAKGLQLEGFDAWRHLLARFPLTFMLSGLLWIPGISHAGRLVYDRVAAHRANAHVCSVQPASSFEEDATWKTSLDAWRTRLEPAKVGAR